MNLRIHREDAALVVVDVQEKLAAAMPAAPLHAALRCWLHLIEMAARLKLPVAVSEQYPKGLGGTVPVVKEALNHVLPPARFFEKTSFSCVDEPLFGQFLAGGRRTLVVCGMEAHVCVYQTVRDLRERGFDVHVPADAVLSRTDANLRVGLDLMARAGAVPTSTETVLFDLVQRAGTDEFRALSKLVK